jgi:hypothetical protein
LLGEELYELPLVGPEMHRVRLLLPGSYRLDTDAVSCHSYNTVQLQILSGPDADRDNLQAANASGPDDSEMSRTRPADRHTQPAILGHHVSQPSQHAHTRPSSSGADSGNGVRFSPFPWPRRTGRSASPPCVQPPALAEIEMDDEDEEEVDFWGGSSPRDQTIEYVRDDGGGDEDEGMDEGTDDDTDDAEDIDIFGHR